MFPERWHRESVIGPPWSYMVGAVIGVTLVGFHFAMLIECARGGRWTIGRVFWLAFFLLIPIAPAVIYLLFTRSRSFHSPIAPKQNRAMETIP
jgi:hypothetical protein